MMAARCQNGFHRLGHQIVLVAILLGGQQLITRLAIQHVIRLTTRRARQRQRAKVCPLFTQQQFRARAQQHAAIFQWHMEVEAGRILGDQSLHQRAAVDAVAGGNIDKP